jgi:hypothetical protein
MLQSNRNALWERVSDVTNAAAGKYAERSWLTNRAQAANYGVYIPVVRCCHASRAARLGAPRVRVKENIVQRGVFTSFTGSGVLAFSDVYGSRGLGCSAMTVQHR